MAEYNVTYMFEYEETITAASEVEAREKARDAIKTYMATLAIDHGIEAELDESDD